MKSKSFVLIGVGVFCGLLVLAACQKGEEKPVAAKEMKGAGASMQRGMGGKQCPKEMLEAMQKGEKSGPSVCPTPGGAKTGKKNVPVTVPAAIQGKWKALVINVLNKKTKNSRDFTLKMNEEFAIPDTKMKLRVLAFLPHFTMSPGGITSVSNDPVNPAAQVIIYDNGSSVFEGWLFEKYPSIHPFEHNLYQITLKDQKPA
ncbi:MAG: DUF2155 domain-containing protein [Pseudomonadota bacterium]